MIKKDIAFLYALLASHCAEEIERSYGKNAGGFQLLNRIYDPETELHKKQEFIEEFYQGREDDRESGIGEDFLDDLDFLYKDFFNAWDSLDGIKSQLYNKLIPEENKPAFLQYININRHKKRAVEKKKESYAQTKQNRLIRPIKEARDLPGQLVELNKSVEGAMRSAPLKPILLNALKEYQEELEKEKDPKNVVLINAIINKTKLLSLDSEDVEELMLRAIEKMEVVLSKLYEAADDKYKKDVYGREIKKQDYDKYITQARSVIDKIAANMSIADILQDQELKDTFMTCSLKGIVQDISFILSFYAYIKGDISDMRVFMSRYGGEYSPIAIDGPEFDEIASIIWHEKHDYKINFDSSFEETLKQDNLVETFITGEGWNLFEYVERERRLRQNVAVLKATDVIGDKEKETIDKIEKDVQLFFIAQDVLPGQRRPALAVLEQIKTVKKKKYKKKYVKQLKKSFDALLPELTIDIERRQKMCEERMQRIIEQAKSRGLDLGQGFIRKAIEYIDRPNLTEQGARLLKALNYYEANDVDNAVKELERGGYGADIMDEPSETEEPIEMFFRFKSKLLCILSIFYS